MAKKVECEIFIAMNEDGEWQMGSEADDAVNGLDGICIRTVKISAYITPPEITETELDIPDEAGETKEVEATAA